MKIGRIWHHGHRLPTRRKVSAFPNAPGRRPAFRLGGGFLILILRLIVIARGIKIMMKSKIKWQGTLTLAANTASLLHVE